MPVMVRFFFQPPSIYLYCCTYLPTSFAILLFLCSLLSIQNVSSLKLQAFHFFSISVNMTLVWNIRFWFSQIDWHLYIWILDHIQDTIGLLFKYIELLQHSGVCQWIFDEVFHFDNEWVCTIYLHLYVQFLCSLCDDNLCPLLFDACF